jgi:hypothetical protein
MSKIKISEEQLRDLYEKEKLTTFQIAKQLGYCQATVWKTLKKFKIKSRLPGVERVNISKEKLEELYNNKKISTWEIEKITKIPRSTIHRKLKEYKITTRDRAIAHIINFRKDFSGDLIEKAYLIGFRIGDLGVRKIYPNSKTITVASGSTIKEQIDLIENIFKNYGLVRISVTKKGKTNIWVALNESFEFLLSKEFPRWVLKDKNFFFSFLAGFIDAEGSIGVYNKMARFSLGNYNKEILFIIYGALLRYDIKLRQPFSDKRKGKKNNEGYIYRENYWNLRINNKSELEKFLILIKPYIRHANKIKSLNNALLNINERNNKKHEKK